MGPSQTDRRLLTHTHTHTHKDPSTILQDIVALRVLRILNLVLVKKITLIIQPGLPALEKREKKVWPCASFMSARTILRSDQKKYTYKHYCYRPLS